MSLSASTCKLMMLPRSAPGNFEEDRPRKQRRNGRTMVSIHCLRFLKAFDSQRHTARDTVYAVKNTWQGLVKISAYGSRTTFPIVARPSMRANASFTRASGSRLSVGKCARLKDVSNMFTNVEGGNTTAPRKDRGSPGSPLDSTSSRHPAGSFEEARLPSCGATKGPKGAIQRL